MEYKSFSVPLRKKSAIAIKVIPGHFTTSNVHVNHYLDVSSLKANASIAKEVARELAVPYATTTIVDTIVCMEKTSVIGAYLAQELLNNGMLANTGSDIHVITPISNTSGKLIFHSL